jgi:hypothetical protein
MPPTQFDFRQDKPYKSQSPTLTSKISLTHQEKNLKFETKHKTQNFSSPKILNQIAINEKPRKNLSQKNRISNKNFFLILKAALKIPNM